MPRILSSIENDGAVAPYTRTSSWYGRVRSIRTTCTDEQGKAERLLDEDRGAGDQKTIVKTTEKGLRDIGVRSSVVTCKTRILLYFIISLHTSQIFNYLKGPAMDQVEPSHRIWARGAL